MEQVSKHSQGARTCPCEDGPCNLCLIGCSGTAGRMTLPFQGWPHPQLRPAVPEGPKRRPPPLLSAMSSLPFPAPPHLELTTKQCCHQHGRLCLTPLQVARCLLRSRTMTWRTHGRWVGKGEGALTAAVQTPPLSPAGGSGSQSAIFKEICSCNGSNHVVGPSVGPAGH